MLLAGLLLADAVAVAHGRAVGDHVGVAVVQRVGVAVESGKRVGVAVVNRVAVGERHVLLQPARFHQRHGGERPGQSPNRVHPGNGVPGDGAPRTHLHGHGLPVVLGS